MPFNTTGRAIPVSIRQFQNQQGGGFGGAGSGFGDISSLFQLPGQQQGQAPAGPSLEDIIARNFGPGGKFPNRLAAGLFGRQLLGPLEFFGLPAATTGLGTLNQILQSQGRTQPLLLNRQLGDIARSAEARAQDIEGGAAASGLVGSGAVQALAEAARQSGLERRAGALAREDALTEQRRRGDLDLLNQLILANILPSLNLPASTARGQGSNTTEAIIGALGAVLGGLA